MKKKFSLWFNIATICLCVCAIAIGVYAAQSATLNVTGSIGFTAHGLDATVKVEMYGHATSEAGTPVASTAPSVIKDTTAVTNEMTISLNTFYFTDMSSEDGSVEDIVIKFTYQNKSAFEVLAKVTTEESAICANSSVTAEIVNAYMGKGSSTSPASGEMTVTLKLAEGATDFESSNVTINITLEKTTAKKYTSGDNKDKALVVNKYTAEEQSDIWDKTVGTYKDSSSFESTYGYSTNSDSYATYFPYYITMGKVGDEDIKWLIVGTNNNGTVTALTTEDKAILDTGKLLADTTYVALSAEALTTYNFLSSSNYEYDSSTKIYKNTKTDYSSLGVNANDYYASDVREYLNGTFKTSYSLSNTDITITPRALTELYTEIVATDSSEVSDGKISTQAQVGDAKDNFWLLSKVEIDTLFKSNITKTYWASASITTVLGTTESSPCWWWLRSPFSSNSSYARGVSRRGDVGYTLSVSGTSGAVRAAFQF